MTTMSAKLHININEGTLSAEGSEDFVQTIYSDFRTRLIDEAVRRKTPIHEISEGHDRPALPAPREYLKKKEKSANPKKTNAGRYVPQFDPNLDLSGLPAFYGRFNPKNHSEKILLFAVFVRDYLKKTPCIGNDIFSCYFTLKSQTEIPEAFQQAFITGFNRTGWVKFISKDEIKITTAGENHFTELSKSNLKNE